MATFGIIDTFAGGTQEQYERSLAVVYPDGGASLPDGQLLHLAGPSEDGWVIVAVHDSKESWEKFRDDTLLPTLPTVQNGLAGPPVETTFEVTKFHTQHRA